MGKRKIAIIGAGLFQEPAILKAKEMGIETHVFAWEVGDPGEKMADYFYPVSIREKDEILKQCQKIGIDGIISIASDLAMDSVNYVAEKMGLVGNTMEATMISTNKHLMRQAFEECGDPSPKSTQVDMKTNLHELSIEYPVIVKPTDRSGSRGIRIVEKRTELEEAVQKAIEESFEKKALIEEYVAGDEYSVEFISYKGRHYMLAITAKTTSGAPYFIELSHIQPANVSPEREKLIKDVSMHALDTLHLDNGAAHVELKVNDEENAMIIEIGGRMGGGFLGSDLVKLSTGYDFVEAVIKIAMGEEIEMPEIKRLGTYGIKFITRKKDVEEYMERKQHNPKSIVREAVDMSIGRKDEPEDINDRKGYYIYKV